MEAVEYRDIPGHPGYRVGSDGSVWSCLKGQGRRPAILGERWHRLRSGRHRSGHLMASLRGKSFFVHRLVLTAFVGPCPDGMQCCHNDGNPANNVLSNLRWDTPKANSADAARHGVTPRGSKHWKSRLTEEAVAEIRRAPASVPSGEIAQRFGVSSSAVQRVRSGRLWRHAGGESPHPSRGPGVKNHQSKLNDDSVRAIRLEYAAGATLKQLGAKYGVSFALVGMIVRRKAWRHVA